MTPSLTFALLLATGALRAVESLPPSPSDKYPSLAFDAAGRLWLARVTMNGDEDAVVVRAREGGRWTADTVIARGIEGAPRLLADGGRIWLFWHGRRRDGWGVYARRFERGRWGPETRVSNATTSALHPVAARDGRGRLFLAYEVLAGGSFTIEVRVSIGGRWSAPARVASGGIERRPAIAAGSGPGAWLAWDSTRAGNPDVFVARVDAEGAAAPSLGPQQQVTADAAIDDTPSLAVDPRDGTLWLAWNSMRGHGAEPLRTDRHGGDAFVRALRGGRWLAPPSPHAGGLPGQVSFGAVNKTPRDAVEPYWHWKQTQNYPIVALDARARPWVIWRTDATGAHNFDLWARVYDGGAWSDELRLTTPYGGRDEWPSTALSAAGELWIAWEGQPDPSDRGGPSLGRGDVDAFNTLAAPNGVFVGRLEHPSPPATPAPLAPAPPETFRAEELRLLPAAGPPAGGVATEDGRHHIYFGDPHSHSILSDGKTGHTDQVLYLARDRFGLDFAVVSDHSEMGRLQNGEYAEIRSVARAFTEPGRFLSFSGFEWTAGARFGHRVVLFKQDEAPQLAFSSPEGQDIAALYDLARRHDGLLSPHHTGHATWGRWNPEHHDAEVEPNFEIASWHGRFEFYENPWQGRRQVPGHQYQDQLRRGRKVGVMGASDTHHLQPGQGGLTAVIAESLDRGPLFEAVRRRRNYATTGAKIVLEFTANGAPMGSVIEASGPVSLVVRVEGTAALDRVEIVKDLVDAHAAVRVEQNPDGPDGAFVLYDPADPQGGRTLPRDDMSRLRFEAKDAGESGREHVYYVRVTQADREQAWSSPIWVTFRSGDAATGRVRPDVQSSIPKPSAR
jgi:hypothetical protein